MGFLIIIANLELALFVKQEENDTLNVPKSYFLVNYFIDVHSCGSFINNKF